jgi:hypothetical protein
MMTEQTAPLDLEALIRAHIASEASKQEVATLTVQYLDGGVMHMTGLPYLPAGRYRVMAIASGAHERNGDD